MARGQKYNDDIKQKALVFIATNNNDHEISRQLGIPERTINEWRRQNQNDPDFAQLHLKKKQEFVENAWEIIEGAQTLLKRRISRAVENEAELDRMIREINKLPTSEISNEQRKELFKKLSSIKVEDVSKISTVLGTLYDKQAVANNEETEITKTTVTIEDYLRNCKGAKY